MNADSEISELRTIERPNMSNHGQDHKLTPEPARRIAVVAVHGVGDHPPFVTSRQIGDLLSNLEYKPKGSPSGSPRYTPFTETIKRINVRPVRVVDSDTLDASKTWGPLHAVSQAVFHGRGQMTAASGADDPQSSLDHLFMKGQLVKYKGEHPEDTYQCLRLEGKRLPDPSQTPGAKTSEPAHDAAGAIRSRLEHAHVELPEQPPDDKEKLIHIYEMYWSDLSALGNAFTRIFGELYQLLFHLGSVSVNNVLAAATHFYSKPGTRSSWRNFARAQGAAGAMLAWPVPILNLYLAVLATVLIVLSPMRVYLSSRGEFVALDALTASLCIAASGYILLRRGKFPAYLFPLPLLFLAILAILTGVYAKPFARDVTEGIFAALISLLALGVFWLIISAYDRRRPGSKRAAVLIGALFALAAAAAIVFHQIKIDAGPYPVFILILNLMEIALGLLAISWIAFGATFVWAHFAGWRAIRTARSGDPADYSKARRTRWTAQLILALCALIFVSLTVVLWTGVVKVSLRALPGEENAAAAASASNAFLPALAPDAPCHGPTCPPIAYYPLGSLAFQAVWNTGLIRLPYTSTREVEAIVEKYNNPHHRGVGRWADQILFLSGAGLLPVFIGAFAIVGLIVLWSMFPSVWCEVRPPQESDQSDDQLAAESTSLGVWLDRGFGFMRAGGEILYWTGWLPGLIVLFLIFSPRSMDWLIANQGHLYRFIGVVGTFVAGGAIGLLAFSGRLKNVAAGFRPVLRVMLDVDNWLREHPRDSNPTARICGRYISLLRYIASWQDEDPDSSHYDAVVILAHSQGTVISADFLRFLEIEKALAGSTAAYDRELAPLDKMSLSFFSMGCPLRQLYGLRFPYLYGWAWNDAANLNLEPGSVSPIDPSTVPSPAPLGVRRWLNAYRSGDYIGRYLWRGGDRGYEWHPMKTAYDERWNPPAGEPERVSADHSGTRIEFCIGPGAHTHYWDHTGGLIAEVLDRLIVTATAAHSGPERSRTKSSSIR